MIHQAKINSANGKAVHVNKVFHEQFPLQILLNIKFGLLCRFWFKNRCHQISSQFWFHVIMMKKESLPYNKVGVCQLNNTCWLMNNMRLESFGFNFIFYFTSLSYSWSFCGVWLPESTSETWSLHFHPCLKDYTTPLWSSCLYIHLLGKWMTKWENSV